MLRSVKDLQGYAIRATDGEIGKVKEFYFDDQSWTVRYLVADTGGWLTGRLVLIAPNALGKADTVDELLPVSLSREQVENSPSIYEDQPVSRQYEASYYDYYGWPYYWGRPYPLGAPGAYPTVAGLGMNVPPAQERADEVGQEEGGDPHLRSTEDVIGHSIQARDGDVGHVEDFVVDDETWTIRHIVVDTRDWLPGKKVLVSPQAIEEMDWGQAYVRVNLQRDDIENGPEYDRSALDDQEQYTRLYG